MSKKHTTEDPADEFAQVFAIHLMGASIEQAIRYIVSAYNLLEAMAEVPDVREDMRSFAEMVAGALKSVLDISAEAAKERADAIDPNAESEEK